MRPLGQSAYPLFQNVPEVFFQSRMQDQQRFAEESADFCASDIKSIAEFRQQRQSEVGAFRRQSVSAACAVDIQKESEAVTDAADISELPGGIECAQLRGLGEIYETGLNHVLSGLVAVVIFAEPEDLLCGDFAAVIGQCEHLVSGGLDGAALVNGDMPGIPR